MRQLDVSLEFKSRISAGDVNLGSHECTDGVRLDDVTRGSGDSVERSGCCVERSGTSKAG